MDYLLLNKTFIQHDASEKPIKNSLHCTVARTQISQNQWKNLRQVKKFVIIFSLIKMRIIFVNHQFSKGNF